MTQPATTLRLLAILCAASTPMLAQDAPPAPEAPPVEAAKELPGPQARLDFSAQHNAASDFSDAPGDVNINRGSADISVVFTTDERSRIVAGFGVERSWYSFDNATGFVSGSSEPWDNVVTADASVLFSRQHDDVWSYYAGLGVTSSGQDGASLGDTLMYAGVVGAAYGVNENLTIGLGLGARSVLEDDATVLPYPTVDWAIDEQWRLATELVRGRYAVALSYTASEELTLRLAAGLQSRHFRLDDEASVPNGIGRDSRVPISLGMVWQMHPQATLSAEFGVNAGQEFTLDDATGARVSRLDADIGFFAGLGASISF